MIWKNKFDINTINNISVNTMVQNLGIKFIEIGDDYISASMPIDSRTVQPMRILHGGASVALAETLGSVASFACIDANKYNTVGIEINANHLKAMPEGSGKVLGKATPIKIGKKLHIWNIEITDEKGNMVCISRLTTMVVPKAEKP
ncbi:MAG TPA: hotdog fold thioesterase [Bacteroidetes bacterium]|nr:hotdog fold thioesterase [Bacteroidota bacterium]